MTRTRRSFRLSRFFDRERHAERIGEIINLHQVSPSGIAIVDGFRIQIERGIFNPAFGTFGRALHRVVLQELPPGLVAADVGCGSGFIACGLAKFGIRTLATDIDPHCELVVKSNAHTNGVRVEFRLGNAADAMGGIEHEESFDLVVANLPFCRAELLSWLEETPYYSWFAVPEGFLWRCTDQVFNRLKTRGRFVFCYASSGWIDELEDTINRKDVEAYVHTDELAESGSEQRWIVELRKLK